MNNELFPRMFLSQLEVLLRGNFFLISKSSIQHPTQTFLVFIFPMNYSVKFLFTWKFTWNFCDDMITSVILCPSVKAKVLCKIAFRKIIYFLKNFIAFFINSFLRNFIIEWKSAIPSFCLLIAIALAYDRLLWILIEVIVVLISESASMHVPVDLLTDFCSMVSDSNNISSDLVKFWDILAYVILFILIIINILGYPDSFDHQFYSYLISLFTMFSNWSVTLLANIFTKHLSTRLSVLRKYCFVYRNFWLWQSN